jgi:hypothetical protein
MNANLTLSFAFFLLHFPCHEGTEVIFVTRTGESENIFFRADPTVLTIFLIKSRSHERLINTTPRHAAHDFFHIKTNLAKYWEIVGANVRQGCVLSPRLFHTVLKCYAVSNAKMEFSHWTCKFGLDGWVALFHGFTFFKREFVFSQWEQCARTHTLKKKVQHYNYRR